MANGEVEAKFKKLTGTPAYRKADQQSRELMHGAFYEKYAVPATLANPALSGADPELLRANWLSLHPASDDFFYVPPPTAGEEIIEGGKSLLRGAAGIPAMVADVAAAPLSLVGHPSMTAKDEWRPLVEPMPFTRAVYGNPQYGQSERFSNLQAEYPGFATRQMMSEAVGAEIPMRLSMLPFAPNVTPLAKAGKFVKPRVGPLRTPGAPQRGIEMAAEQHAKRPLATAAQELTGAMAAGAAVEETRGQEGVSPLLTPIVAGLFGAGFAGQVARVHNRFAPKAVGGMGTEARASIKMTQAEKVAAEIYDRAMRSGGEDFDSQGLAQRVAILNKLGLADDFLDTATLTSDEGLMAAVNKARQADPNLDIRLKEMEVEYASTTRRELAPEGDLTGTVEQAKAGHQERVASLTNELAADLDELGSPMNHEQLGQAVRESLTEGEGPALKEAAQELYAVLQDPQLHSIELSEMGGVIDTLRREFSTTQYDALEPPAVATVRLKVENGEPITLRDLEGMRQMLRAERRTVSRGLAEGSGQKSKIISTVLDALNEAEATAVASGGFDDATVKRLSIASKLYGRYGSELGYTKRGRVAKEATRAVGGDFAINEAQVASKVITPNMKSPASVRDYLRALGADPAAREAGVENVRRFLVGRLVDEVPAGEAPSQRALANFRKKYKVVLEMAEFKDLNAKLTGMESRTRVLGEYGLSGAKELADIESKAFSTITKQDPAAVVGEILAAGNKNPSATVDSYLRILSESPGLDADRAKSALRRGVFDEIFNPKHGSEISPTAETTRIGFKRIEKALEAGSPQRKALERLFTRQELRMWEETAQLQKLMTHDVGGMRLGPREYGKLAEVMRSTGIGRVVYWTSARRLPLMMAAEAFLTGADRVLSRATQDEAEKIFSTMMSNQKYAKNMRKRWKAQPEREQFRMLKELLVGAVGVERANELMQGEE